MLGRIVGSEMQLSSLGTIVRDCWVDLSNHHRGLELDAFVVMPNHMHGILIIADGGESAGSNRDAGEAGLAPTVAYSG